MRAVMASMGASTVYHVAAAYEVVSPHGGQVLGVVIGILHNRQINGVENAADEDDGVRCPAV